MTESSNNVERARHASEIVRRKPRPLNRCKHDGTHSFGCNFGVTRCDKCGKMFGIYNINLERLS